MAQDNRLTDDEFSTLMSLLRRFCASELDQFALLRTSTEYGDVFITISRIPAGSFDPPGLAESYSSIDEL